MRALFSFLPLFAPQKARFFRALALSLLTLAAGIALLGVSGWFLTAAALTTAGVAFNLFVPSAGVRGLSFGSLCWLSFAVPSVVGVALAGGLPVATIAALASRWATTSVIAGLACAWSWERMLR